MKIYAASSWKNVYYDSVVSTLRNENYVVYDFTKQITAFQWSDVSSDWSGPKQVIKNMQHSIARKSFQSDYFAITQCNVCVLVLPSGRSSHLEAGVMKGLGKKLYIYAPELDQPELMYLMADGIYTDIQELLEELRKL